MDAVRTVEAEVRELIRRSGLDPAREPGAVQRLVRDAVADYDQRSMHGGMPVLGDVARAEKSVWDNVAGFGPLQQYFDDPTVEEIWVNEPSRVFVARGGVAELTTTLLTATSADLANDAEVSGSRVDRSARSSTRSCDGCAARSHDITREQGTQRQQGHRQGDNSRPVRPGLTPGRDVPEAAVASGLNGLVDGGTQAGSDHDQMPCAPSPLGRVWWVKRSSSEDPGRTSRRCSPATLDRGPGESRCAPRQEALRMRPSRIIVGEVRQAESLDLLIALNSGLPGMCTIHANSAREAITKMCTLPLLAGENVGSRFVVPTVAGSIDIVIHAALERDGTRRVREIAAVPGRVEGDVVEIADLFVQKGGELVRATGTHRTATGSNGRDTTSQPVGPGIGVTGVALG